MKASCLILIFCVGLTSALFAVENVAAEQEAIKNVINEAYVDGLCNSGDIINTST